jgi:hypothetical protein
MDPNPNAPTIEITVNSVEDQPAQVSWHGQTHHYNLSQILEFKDDIEEATATHAQKQSYWEQLAIEVASKVLEFEEVSYAKWFAHARRYARLVMHALAVKETLEAMKDWTITLFSSDLSEPEREAYVQTSYRGWLLEKFGTGVKVEAYLAKNEYEAEFNTFRQGMLGYLAAGWTYEKVQLTLRQLKEQKLKVEAFAKSMNERSFKMASFQQIQSAKFGNVDPFKKADKSRPTISSQSSGRIEIDERSTMDELSKSKQKK